MTFDVKTSVEAPILLTVTGVAVLLPNEACDEVKLKLGIVETTGLTELKLKSVEAVPTVETGKLKVGFAQSTVFVAVLGFSLVPPAAPNENVTLFVPWSLLSELSCICCVQFEVAGSLLKPEFVCASPSEFTVTSTVSEDRHFFGIPPDGLSPSDACD